MCQTSFLPAVLESVGSILDVRQTFIAEVQPERPFGVACMHDDAECEGDAVQLCVEKHAADKLVQFLGEVNEDQSYIPRNTESSLRDVGTPERAIARVLSCASGEEGKALLVKSAKRADSLGIVRSCSMFLQEEEVCGTDDGKWLGCTIDPNADAWISAICDAYLQLHGSSQRLPSKCRAKAFLHQEGYSLVAKGSVLTKTDASNGMEAPFGYDVGLERQERPEI